MTCCPKDQNGNPFAPRQTIASQIRRFTFVSSFRQSEPVPHRGAGTSPLFLNRDQIGIRKAAATGTKVSVLASSFLLRPHRRTATSGVRKGFHEVLGRPDWLMFRTTNGAPGTAARRSANATASAARIGQTVAAYLASAICLSSIATRSDISPVWNQVILGLTAIGSIVEG